MYRSATLTAAGFIGGSLYWNLVFAKLPVHPSVVVRVIEKGLVFTVYIVSTGIT